MTQAPTPTLSYPAAPRLDLVDELHGRPVPDPYRWLEDAGDPRTREWSAAQDGLARSWLDALPGRAALGDRLRDMLRAGSTMAPAWRAGRAFFRRRGPDQEHPVLYVREGDAERVVLDVTALDPTGQTTLDGWAPSPDGRLLAYRLSTGGDEESSLSVLDVDTGEVLEGPIDRCRVSPVAWLPDGSGFYYVRQLPPDEIPPGEEMLHRRVWRHALGTDPDTDALVHGDGLDPTNYYGIDLSTDGRWLVVTARPGTAPRQAVWLADLHGDGTLRELIGQDAGAYCHTWVERDGRLYLLTTLGAPRYRLCVADPEHPEPEHWTELIAEEPDSVLDAVRWLDGGEHGPRLVALRTRHAVSEVHLHDPGSGRRLDRVPLPGTGSVVGLSTVDDRTEAGRDTVWLGWTDFVTPPCVHRFSLAERRTELVEAAPGAVALPDINTRQVAYPSADGTTVRMFLISRTGRPDVPRPTLLTGYGGFSISREPGYSASTLAWVEAGGVWAVASLRGGGEEGEEWHRAGMRERKQNVFNDFHAAARHLVDTGWTTPDRLAIMGGSNGGLLVGAALTQRPELYRAVVCSAPLLDMVRYERFLLGRIWNDEYGTADDPEELGWLLSYSPYHHVRDRVAYPAVLFTVFESDTRVDPCHARKMCAALQHATAADVTTSPVLIRRETEVGHGARAVSRTVDLAVDQLGFLAHATGLDLEVLPR
ncbi:prolyl oligopeptidase family serine peptidase [Gandjariella thermophila]|uniref:prolyl oligopeptidase n=1 Tax=Gandjariella thermophila TaxID=1931992 RepID=A0A4D4JEK7_9PSEU|nr:prolyl oligopeptidase family serine peptidase [Gandjariella thermophila]GDY32347.1 prolyl endopeptidase [Gandjariella thermophila]